MINIIPRDKRNRVAIWFSNGGPNNDWNYLLFIEHFNDNFEDKTATRTAGEKLSRMRQGEHQTFSAYLNDFEYMLAQAKGLNWDGRLKVNLLSGELNDRLTDRLISVNLSDDDYTLYVKQVHVLAERQESRENFYPKNGTRKTKTWFITRSATIPQIIDPDHQIPEVTQRQVTAPQLDADGGILMSGINGASIATLTAIVNAVNSQNKNNMKGKNKKPPAQWRT